MPVYISLTDTLIDTEEDKGRQKISNPTDQKYQTPSPWVPLKFYSCEPYNEPNAYILWIT